MKEVFEDGEGVKWAYDPDRMAGLLRSVAFLQATVSNSSVAVNRDHWLAKLRMVKPTAEVKSDLNQVNLAKERLLNEFNKEISRLKSGGWSDLELYLCEKRAKAERLQVASQQMFRTSQDINDMAIKSAETGMKYAKGVRDASIVGLGIIATVSTGGATLALATTAGAGLQGTATYQDTGSVSKAIASGAFVAIPVGVGQGAKHLVQAGQIGKGVATTLTVLVDISTDASNEYFVKGADDMSIEKAISTALVNKGADVALKGLTKNLATEVGKTLRDTIVIMNDHSGNGSNRATPLLVETAKAIGKAAGGAAAQPSGVQTAPQVMLRPAAQPVGPVAMQCMVPSTSMMWVNSNVMRRI